nr:MAG: nucleocapsid protein [brine shrimp rhabdovirus 1]
MYCAESGEKVEVIELRPNNVPTYASEFFKSNKSTKPTIIVYTTSPGTNLTDLTYHVREKLEKNLSLGVDIVNCYLVEVLKEEKVISKEKWISFGVEICDSNEEVTPLSLAKFEVKKRDIPINKAPPGSNLSVELHKWLITVIFGLHRLNLAVDMGPYRTNMTERLHSLCKNIDAAKVIPNSNIAMGWDRDNSFVAIAACCDMFWNRYPDSEFSIARFGTIITRLKDSAMIGSIVHLQKVTGMDQLQIMDWIFDKSMGREWKKIFKPNEELDNQYSYVHYISALKLAQKSPYSASESPLLHLWIHMTCALLGSDRSRHARIPEEVAMSKIRVYAILLAYSQKESTTIFKTFTQKKSGGTPVVLGVGSSTSKSQIVTLSNLSLSGEHWYNKFSCSQFKLSQSQKDFYNERAKALKEGAREKTVGQWISKNTL